MPKSEARRVIVLVADGLGIGEAPDAEAFGTTGANTIGNLARKLGGLALPTLEAWGLGCLAPIVGVPPVQPQGVVARLVEKSAANDSTVGHWELMGLVSREAPPTYPDGFPQDLLDQFAHAIGFTDGRNILGNVAANGYAVIEEFGPAHLATGYPIVYTSSDSVFQVAAHTDVVPVEKLYEWCEAARRMFVGANAVGRVIARPFDGTPGSFRRLPSRRDWNREPPGVTAVEVLSSVGVPTIAIGKVGDIFAHKYIGEEAHPGGNAECLSATSAILDRVGPLFAFVNLVDFDSRYGHPRRPHAFADALGDLDVWLAETMPLLREGDRVILTADHGNDPTYIATTDHTRERVPLVAWGPDIAPCDVGVVPMSALGAAVCALFGANEDLLPGADASGSELGKALR